MRTLLMIAALAIGQMASAQKKVEIKTFRELAVSGGIELTLVASKENKIVIDSGNPDGIKIGSDEGSLAISAEGNNHYKATVYFNGPIEDIAISGGVEIKAKDKIKTKHLSINIAGGSEATLSIEAERLSTAIASGSEMTISGTVKHMEAAVASGGELSAKDLKIENSQAVVASGGEATIYVSGIADATVASGGELTIHGNPKKVNEVKADGAEIKVVR